MVDCAGAATKRAAAWQDGPATPARQRQLYCVLQRCSGKLQASPTPVNRVAARLASCRCWWQVTDRGLQLGSPILSYYVVRLPPLFRRRRQHCKNVFVLASHNQQSYMVHAPFLFLLALVSCPDCVLYLQIPQCQPESHHDCSCPRRIQHWYLAGSMRHVVAEKHACCSLVTVPSWARNPTIAERGATGLWGGVRGDQWMQKLEMQRRG